MDASKAEWTISFGRELEADVYLSMTDIPRCTYAGLARVVEDQAAGIAEGAIDGYKVSYRSTDTGRQAIIEYRTEVETSTAFLGALAKVRYFH